MKFRDLFVPRWQHSDPEVRKKALERIKYSSMLEQIAEKDEDPEVREAAAQKLQRLVYVTEKE